MPATFDFLPILLASQQADAGRRQADIANRQADANRAEADRQFGLQRDQLNYFRDRDRQDRAAIQPLLDTIRSSAQTNATNAAADRRRYETVFQPLENQLVADANSYASSGRRELEMGRAMSLVSDQMEGQRRSATRNLESFGIDPTAVRYAGLDANMRALSGAAQAAAGNQAYQNVDATARQLRGQAIGIGQALPGQAIQASNSSTGAASTGAGTVLGQTTTAANTTGTPVQYASLGTNNLSNATGAINAATGAINAGTAGVNAVNQGYSNYYNNQNAGGGSGWGSLLGLAAGTAVGTAMGNRGGLSNWLGGGGGSGSSNGGMRFPIANSSGGFDQGGWGNGVNYAEGGPVPDHASPTDGAAIDDVPARLTAGEFVIPKDTLQWKGEEFFQKLIEQSRKAKDQAVAKPEVGVAPQLPPTFVSRPQGGALPVG